MKKITLMFVMLTFVVSLSSMAQVTYGPRLGLNFSNFGGSDAGDTKMKIGFHLGGFGNYTINDMFSVQAELLFDAKGAKSEYTDMNNVKQTVPLSLSYLSLPILAKATFGNDLKFFGEVGPSFGFLMGAKFDGDSEYTTYDFDPLNPFAPPVEKKVKYKDSFKGMDMGIAIGGGVNVPVGDMMAVIGLRYIYSLGTISDKVEGSDSTPNITNSVIAINLALSFGGK